MRLPVVPQISTKDGLSNKNARLTNCLKESKKSGDKAVIRPGLVLDAVASGVGRGLVVFNNDLVSVYGTTLGFGVEEAGGAPTLDQYTSMTTMLPQGLIFDNSIYVCTGTHSGTGETRVFSSVDGGQTWSAGTLTTVLGGFSAQCIDWNGTTFCAIAMDDDLGAVESYTSTNGTSWTKNDLATTWVEFLNNIGGGMVWDGSNFIFMSDKFIMTSADGVSWSETNPKTNSLSLVWGRESVGGVTVFVGDEGFSTNTISVSSDGGSTWAYSTPSDTGANFYSGICHNGSAFFIISGYGDSLTPRVCSSSGGTSFTELSTLLTFTNTFVGDPVALNRIAWNGTYFCATCPNGFYALSTDGVTWDEYEESGFAFAQIIGTATGFLATATNGRTAVITTSSASGTIPALATITGDHYDFAQGTI